MTRPLKISADRFAKLPPESQVRAVQDAFGSACDQYFTGTDNGKCERTARKIASFLERLPPGAQSNVLTGLNNESRTALFRMLVFGSSNEEIASTLLGVPEIWVPGMIGDILPENRIDIQHLMEASGPMPQIDEDDFEKRVLRSRWPVAVYVGASWCGPCKKMKPVMKEVANEFGEKMTFLSMDFDRLSDKFQSNFGVSAPPCVLFFKDGRLVESIEYENNKEKIAAMIQKICP